MMKMKLNKKIAGAAAMLLLSTTMLGTSTFAWFTMSRTVKVDGMEVKTKVSGNLLISDTNTSDAYYGTQLTQSVQALLEPVSTVNGVDGTFYYTLDAKADGSKLNAITGSGAVPFIAYDASAAATDTTNYANKFSEDYAVTKGIAGNAFTGKEAAEGYVDYVFYLKATPDEANNEIRLTRCNLAYNDAAIANSGSDVTLYDKAWRIAVFAEKTSVGTFDATPSSATTKLKDGILGLDKAAYFEDKAVSGVAATAAPTLASSGVVIDTGLGAGIPAYYKVVVRLWLEGQDTACKTETYVNLSNAWKLDLQFDLVPSTDTALPAVKAIATDTPATVNDDIPR
jgi:hypothetical protein